MAFRSIAQANVAGGSASTNPGLPTGSVAGDTLIAYYTSDGTGGGNLLPTGFTLGSNDNVTNGDAQTLGWGWKVAVGSDATTFANTGASAFGCFIAAYSGRVTVSPVETSSVNNPNLVTPPSSPVTVTGTGVTTANVDDIVFLASVDTNGLNGTWSPGGSLNTRGTIPAASSFSAAAFYDFTQSSSGATGNQTATWTQSGAFGNITGYVVALKPAGGGATFPPVPGSPNVMPGFQQHNALMVNKGKRNARVWMGGNCYRGYRAHVLTTPRLTNQRIQLIN